MASSDETETAGGRTKTAEATPSRPTINRTLKFSLGMGVLALAILVALCFVFPWDEPQYARQVGKNLLVFVLGWGCGWVSGTLLAPTSKAEDEMFQKIAKGIWLFLSGYILAKLDPIFSSLHDANYLPPSEAVLVKVVLFIATTILVMMIVFLARTYGEWHLDKRTTHIAPDAKAFATEGGSIE